MSKWPKHLPALTDEQRRMHDDFLKYWHEEVLPHRYAVMDRFNHGFAAKHSKRLGRVLEIGAGVGEHIRYEDIADTEYHAMELRPEMADVIRSRFPAVRVLTADCQQGIDFPDGFFDKVIAIHVLEHLPALPAALNHIHRVLKAAGEFCVVIPCEGGFLHRMARNISVRPIFKKRYGVDCDLYARTEHINTAVEVLEELNAGFTIFRKIFFPLILPVINLNLAVGLILKKKNGRG